MVVRWAKQHSSRRNAKGKSNIKTERNANHIGKSFRMDGDRGWSKKEEDDPAPGVKRDQDELLVFDTLLKVQAFEQVGKGG